MKFQASLFLLLAGFSDAWVTPLTSKNLQPTAVTTRTDAPRVASPSLFQSASDECANADADANADTPAASTEIPETTGAAANANANTNAMMGGLVAALMGVAAMTASPDAVSAATDLAASSSSSSSSIVTAGAGSVKSALFAYGHYATILAFVGILMTERWTLENGPDLSDAEEDRLAIADTLYGVFGGLLVYTGYYRLSDPALGKGTDFYIHEPIFWLKIAMVGVLGAASFFNTTKIIQRSVARNTGDKTVEPMSQELCDRMKSICNAQLTGMVFIPLAATFMARGIGYNESIPWQAEAGVAALIFVGLGYKYIKEALTFEQRLADKAAGSE
eukprot:CAMPEP_0172387704 /NCGR_PEP_ID=MMETSP1061-20121228/4971_1 /TAXON_ID=37318 /ORGANISM="Pseudo-nitzschia pungens, Strain cf. pungens" /LENGTH=332 /DNA_ID=CAMNT_0013117419 /DNA_START=34 /DNA_END=1032 /DNA_ORIENTATION=+